MQFIEKRFLKWVLIVFLITKNKLIYMIFLQASTLTNEGINQSIFENQLLFVILGLVVFVFGTIRFAKFLSELNFNKTSKKSSCNS